MRARLVAAALAIAATLSCGEPLPDWRAMEEQLRTSYLGVAAAPQDPAIRVYLLDPELKELALGALGRQADFPEHAAAVLALRKWIAASTARVVDAETLLVIGTKDYPSRVVVARFNATGSRLARLGEELRIGDELAAALEKLQRFFRDRRTTPYRLVSTDRLRSALENPRSVTALQMLCDAAAVDQRSELGGLLLLRDTTGGPEITTVDIPSRWRRTADAIQRARGDFAAGLELLDHSPGLFALAESEFRVAQREVHKNFPLATRAARLETFWDLCLFKIRMTYERDDTELVRAVLGGVHGYYVGDFHVHPPDNDPSLEDKMVSMVERVLVVVPRPRGGGFDLVDLFHTAPDKPSRRAIKVRNGRLVD
ncbi:MAG: hypothetical protein HYV63_05705 [Candidatus Schekmanbacteria bacterium]|nr:hypothetical protein [Candidatus Schekmanbacteria bacterium]